VLLRMHAMEISNDVLGEAGSGKAGVLQRAMQAISDAGRGTVVLIRHPRADALSVHAGDASIGEPGDAGGVGPQLRNYGIGAQILLDLGITEMTLLSNTQRTIVGLEGYGLTGVGQQPIPQ